MSDIDELKAVKNFCDGRTVYGHEGAVRDPNDNLGYKNKFIEILFQQAIDAEICISSSDTILDLGCGTGNFTKIISQNAGLAIGLDISSEMLKLAVSHTSPQINYCLYNGLSMPFASRSFDYIITREIFHLLSDAPVSNIASECSRILKSDGRMISIEFGSSNIKRQNGSFGRFERHPNKMIKLFENNNLKCLRYYPIRRGRSIMQYLIRYGFYREDSIARLADKERMLLRNKGLCTSHYNMDYLYIFQPNATL